MIYHSPLLVCMWNLGFLGSLCFKLLHTSCLYLEFSVLGPSGHWFGFRLCNVQFLGFCATSIKLHLAFRMFRVTDDNFLFTIVLRIGPITYWRTLGSQTLMIICIWIVLGLQSKVLSWRMSVDRWVEGQQVVETIMLDDNIQHTQRCSFEEWQDLLSECHTAPLFART